jgi:hypothetical protein
MRNNLIGRKYLKDVGIDGILKRVYENMDYVKLTQNRVQRQNFLKTIMALPVP